MKTTVLLAASAAVALAGCAGIPGTGSNFDFDKFVNNPGCDHTDKVSGVTGAAGIPASLQFSAERNCKAVPPPVVVGTVVAPTDPAKPNP